VCVIFGLPSGVSFGRIRDMSDAAPPAAVPPAPLPWSEEVIFAVMHEPARRRILKALADGQSRTSTELRSVTGKRLDATIKDCAALLKLGFLHAAQDEQDGRKKRYTLAPTVPITKTASGWELDFGCCVLRV
jgi:hypothetical protein